MTQVAHIVDRQIREWEIRKRVDRESREQPPGPVVSLSRDIGCGGRIIAKKLAERLGCDILGRDTIDFIAEDLHTQRRLVDTLDEQGKLNLEKWVDGYLHGAPVEYDEYGKSLIKVIRSAAFQGNIVFLGRGANFILGLDEAFCVRLVAPLEVRVKNLMEYESISEEEAQERIRRTDAQRSEFIRRLFNRDLNDPLAYHITLNLADLDFHRAVEIILEVMRLEGFLKSDHGTTEN